MKKTYLLPFALLVLLQSCQNNTKVNETIHASNDVVENINFKVKNVLPHDKTLFTEGLIVHNGDLIESTGSPEEFKNSKSIIGKVDLKTGKVETLVELDKTKYFGEGITVLNGLLHQLTYKNQIGFVYDAKTFKKLREFTYTNLQGWGLTNDGKSIIMSDGTSQLTFLSPDNLKPVKTLNVTKYGESVDMINELEYIDGYIYANIWLANSIIKIDPSNGKVVGRLDLTSVYTTEKHKNPNGVEMNGIAYDAKANKVYITGKMWEHIYEIEFNK